ncbi:jg24375, partial [Pararge aegeria aegeria]
AWADRNWTTQSDIMSPARC